jgi:hypothetical protein
MTAPLPAQVARDFTPQALRRLSNGDDFLTLLHWAIQHSEAGSTRISDLWAHAPLSVLRSAADLCGVDSTGFSRRQCKTAITENF